MTVEQQTIADAYVSDFTPDGALVVTALFGHRQELVVLGKPHCVAFARSNTYNRF